MCPRCQHLDCPGCTRTIPCDRCGDETTIWDDRGYCPECADPETDEDAAGAVRASPATVTCPRCGHAQDAHAADYAAGYLTEPGEVLCLGCYGVIAA